MMSKNLYLAKWVENCKRRSWSFLLCFVAFLTAYPLTYLIALTNMNNGIRLSMENGIPLAEIELYKQNMQNDFASWTGFTSTFVFMAAFFAVLFAVQGFSYLYSRRKMDLYMSVPVSRPKHFVLLWANGILMFALSYLTGLLLSFGVGAAFGVMNTDIFLYAMTAFLVNMLAFVAMYHLALTAVMLTGNVLTALLGCAVFFFYENAARYFYDGLKSMFFSSYCMADSRRFAIQPVLTPFSGYLRFTGGAYYGTASQANGGLFTECLLLFIAAVLFGAAAYLLFRKRKTESHGKAIVFPAIRPAVEIILLVPISMGIGVIFARMAGDELFLFLGCVLGGLAGHVLIQLIFEMNFRAVLRSWPLAAVCTGLSAAILCVFLYDLTGYDSYLPKKQDIQSLSVASESDNRVFGNYILPLSSKSGSMNNTENMLDNMNTQNEQTIDAVLAMAAEWQEFRNDPDAWIETGNWWVVNYRLKNGRGVYRRFLVDTAAMAEELDTVTRDESFKKIRYQIYDDAFKETLPQMEITYSDGVESILYTADKNKLLEALRSDFDQYSYHLISGGLPTGMLQFEIADVRSTNTAGWSVKWQYPVYSSFSETIKRLEDNEIDAGGLNSFLNPEDVQAIKIHYSHYNKSTDTLFGDEAEAVPDQEITRSFTDPEEISRLLSALYPSELADITDDSFLPEYMDWRFEVDIVLTEEAEKKHLKAPRMYFLKDQEPDFLEKKIKEAAVRG